jgi:hypothetical protein
MFMEGIVGEVLKVESLRLKVESLRFRGESLEVGH